MHKPIDVKNLQDSDEVFALRERVKELEAMVGLRWTAPRCIGLTASQEKIVGLLIKHPTLCARELMFNALYGMRADPPGDEVLRAHVRNTRVALKPFGVLIGKRYGQGYFITPDNLSKLNALYEPGERPKETA